jgi:hypothetical protein
VFHIGVGSPSPNFAPRGPGQTAWRGARGGPQRGCSERAANHGKGLRGQPHKSKQPRAREASFPVFQLFKAPLIVAYCFHLRTRRPEINSIMSSCPVISRFISFKTPSIPLLTWAILEGGVVIEAKRLRSTPQVVSARDALSSQSSIFPLFTT